MSEPQEDELVAITKQALHDLLAIKERLPFLKDFDSEARRMGTHGFRDVKNLIIWQLLLDSFDMLVIHLASLREWMIKKDTALLNRIAKHPERFRYFSVDDCRDLKDDDPEIERGFAEHQMRASNEVIDRLFPNGPPQNEADFKELLKRFMKDTEPIDRDRNEIRAHRYEDGFRTRGGKKYLPLGGVESQVRVFERYLKDLFFVLSGRIQYVTDLNLIGDPSNTAKDMADLVLLRSINGATVEYGLVPEMPEPGKRPDWYWLKRKDFYEGKDRSFPP